jgi:hypothetical protein
MATYYVRNDGSNANAGTGPATNQAWQTVTYALANATLTSGVNTIYIAPGVYRETPTVTITPSITQTLVISGNPTASQFSGVTPGAVKITNFTSDTTDPTSSNVLTISGKTYITIENIFFEQYSTSGVLYMILGASNPDYITIQKCVFSGQDNGTLRANGVSISSSTTINQITITKCMFSRNYTALDFTSSASAGTAQNVACLGSLFMGCDYGVYLGGSGLGRTVYNCTFVFADRFGVLAASAQTGGNSVYNCLFYGGGVALTGPGIVENYNRMISCTPRTNVSPSGANSATTGISGLDIGYGLLNGITNLQMFSTLFGSPNTAFGTSTGAPANDLYGVTWTGATPDAGSATYRSLSNIGSYLPTERNASAITIAPGSTSQSIELYLGATGLTFSTTGLAAYYVRNQSAPVAITLVTQTPTGAWTSGGFAEISSSLVPGVYRLDVPNAAFAAGASDVTIVVRGASGTNGAVLTVTLSSGGLTAAQTAAAVWGESPAGYATATTFGGVLNETNQLTNSIDQEVGDVAGNVWDEFRTNHVTAGTFGQYVNAELVTPVTSAALVRMGPFEVRADGLGASDPLDIQKGAQHGVDIQCVDNNGAGIDITSATVTAKVYNSGATLVDTYSCTATYAADGRATFTIDTTVTNTPGTYTATITRTTGASDTQIFGPLRIYVRDI